MSEHDESQTSASGDGLDGRDDAPSTSSAADTTSGTDPVEPLSLEDQLAAAQAEAAEHYDRLLRAKADIENILKRHQRELSDRARYDGENLAREILSAVDDLERALEHAGEDTTAVAGGVELVLKGLLAALKRSGVEKVEAEGKPFDPSEHEAVTMVETADLPPNTVVAVFRSGYKMRDRLLRAAMVSVSKAPAEPPAN